ncbi:hypothetical protein BLNAU_18560 [Blattamonas nauphoetae]|uniref:Uncharacterized protein n=1 Tax=Blattamonas nauphoetae TaxID=2049346 RepID=A0ABQ9X4L1_9EUKA|nr:hypothetical protein BLNAU_18560 [Blattamonas nauphoetae]
MEFVHTLPILFNIPSTLTFTLFDQIIKLCLTPLFDAQQVFSKVWTNTAMIVVIDDSLRMEGIEDILEEPLKPNVKWDCRRVVSDNLRPPRLHTLCLELRRLLFCRALLFLVHDTLFFRPNPFDAPNTWRWGWSNCGAAGAFVSVTAVVLCHLTS